MITAKERAFLKSKLNTQKPAIRVGKGGVSDELIEAIDLYLNKNKIMKIQLLQNTDVDAYELFDELEEKLGVEFVQKMGSVLSIYRKSDKNIYL